MAFEEGTDESRGQRECGKEGDKVVRVGIIGGGIGGMALALACQRLGGGRMIAEVFERDASFDARSQGYGLTMQQGIKVLNALKVDMENVGVSSSCHFSFLPDGENIGCYGRDVRDVAGGCSGKEDAAAKKENERAHEKKRTGGADDDASAPSASQPLVCWKCKGTGQRLISKRKPHPAPCSVCSGKGTIPPRPACEYNVHLPRQKLREMLMDGLQPGTVAWGHKFKCYEIMESGAVRVEFESGDQSSRVFDILVGCDGIYSGVRRQRLKEERDNQRLNPLNVMVVLGITHLEHPALQGKVFQTLDGETRIYCMPFDAAKEPGEQQPTMWQLSFPIDPLGKVSQDPEELKAEALARCGSWHPPIPDLLKATSPGNITGYPAFDRDVLDAKSLREGGAGGGGPLARVTLLGDAVHPMSPFKGQGANQALLDAFDLAKALLDQCDSKKGHTPLKTNVGDDEGDSIVKALEYFERVMLERSSRKVENSRTAAAVLHTPAACQRANCVRAGAALGEDDPQKQTKRSAVDERDAEIVVSTMKAQMFGLDVS